MDMNEAVAKALQAERAIADLTVRALAKKAGIPERSLMRVLLAERDIKINQVAQLAAAMDLYPHEILERAEQILTRHQRTLAGDAEVIPLPPRPAPSEELPTRRELYDALHGEVVDNTDPDHLRQALSGALADPVSDPDETIPAFTPVDAADDAGGVDHADEDEERED